MLDLARMEQAIDRLVGGHDGAEEDREDDQHASDIFDPPMATIRPTNLELHGQTRVDEYFWLRERENPEVIAYLEAENRYTEAMTAHLEPLSGRLFEEIKGRIKQDDSSVPYRIDDWLYYTRYEDGKQYPIFARKRVDAGVAEEVLLDVNVEAEGHAYFHASADGASPDHRILAWASDTAGRRVYTIRFRDLASGRDLPDVIANVTDNFAWANDSRTIFYTRQDPGTLRWHQVWRHRLGTDPADDPREGAAAPRAVEAVVAGGERVAFAVVAHRDGGDGRAGVVGMVAVARLGARPPAEEPAGVGVGPVDPHRAGEVGQRSNRVVGRGRR